MDAILFDLDNTLINRDQAVHAFCETVVEDRRKDLGLASRRDLVQRLMDWDQHGYPGRAEWGRRVCACLGMQEDRFWREFEHQVPRLIPRDNRIVKQLQELSGRVCVVIVTNGTARMQTAKLQAAGLQGIARDVVISEAVGSWKPDSAIFEHALRAANSSAAKAWMVGDDPIRDMQAAAKLGFRTHWISMGRSFPSQLDSADQTSPTIHECLQALLSHT
ncbi:MAG: HAD family hydrolase [Rubripirellula sp.]